MFRGVADRLGEALAVAIVDAAVLDITHHVAAEFIEAVFFVNNELDVNTSGVGFETIATGFVLNIRMNVGIIPKKRRLDALGTQTVDTINAARSAAGVH